MQVTDSATTSPAFLADLVERLGEPLERIGVGRRGAPRRLALDGHIRALAHGIDQTRLLGSVLDPGAVTLGVHVVARAAELDGRVGIRLEPVADDDRYLVLHLLGRPR